MSIFTEHKKYTPVTVSSEVRELIHNFLYFWVRDQIGEENNPSSKLKIFASNVPYIVDLINAEIENPSEPVDPESEGVFGSLTRVDGYAIRPIIADVCKQIQDEWNQAHAYVGDEGDD